MRTVTPSTHVHKYIAGQERVWIIEALDKRGPDNQDYTTLINLILHCLTGKYAQVTNNPENDGCINAVLLV